MKPTLPDGYTVKFRHQRIAWNDEAGTENPAFFGGTRTAIREAGTYVTLPKGGRTEAFVFDDRGRHVATGAADCSLKDNFNRKIGRDIALGRALAHLKGRELVSAAPGPDFGPED